MSEWQLTMTMTFEKCLIEICKQIMERCTIFIFFKIHVLSSVLTAAKPPYLVDKPLAKMSKKRFHNYYWLISVHHLQLQKSKLPYTPRKTKLQEIFCNYFPQWSSFQVRMLGPSISLPASRAGLGYWSSTDLRFWSLRLKTSNNIYIF